jgi:hypothetical protein
MTDIARPDRGRERPVTARLPAHEVPGPLPLTAPLPAGLVDSMVATAARAPSVHNTQPWRFRAGASGVDLIADPGRNLPGIDAAGRELLVSCGAALFGLRLAVREAGYLPLVCLLPDPAQPTLLARVQLGGPAPMKSSELRLLRAVPHRHTHRGSFDPEPVAAALLTGLQADAAEEGATLCYVDQPDHHQQLAALVAAAARQQEADASALAETRSWTRPGGDTARDGVPARAIPAPGRAQAGRLAQRDFDLGRGFGLLDDNAGPPSATAVLITVADGPADWLRAGQALHRLLLHAASRWVFASLHSQPLELPSLRAEIRARLALPGAPQMLLQLGPVHTTAPTGRRPPAEILD